MPLKNTNSIRGNVKELMGPVVSKSRKRAIQTIAKKNNMSPEDAKFKQAKAIALSIAKKK